MTKDKILSASSRLFYEKGIANVRLQQIADSINISVGNLAYHFPNKQAIVGSVYDSAFEALTKLMEELFAGDTLADFDNSLKSFFKFQTNYNFCFNNCWEISRSYPHLHQKWKTICNRMPEKILRKLNWFNQMDLIIDEPFKTAHKILSENIVLHIVTWVCQQGIKGKPAPQLSFRRTTWALLFTYLTDNGKEAFKELGIE